MLYSTYDANPPALQAPSINSITSRPACHRWGGISWRAIKTNLRDKSRPTRPPRRKAHIPLSIAPPGRRSIHRYRYRNSIPSRPNPPSRPSRLNETRRHSTNRNSGRKARRRRIALQLPRTITTPIDVIAPIDDSILILRPHVKVFQCDVGQGDDITPTDNDGSARDAVIHCPRPASEYQV